jgi:hypothetical protein
MQTPPGRIPIIYLLSRDQRQAEEIPSGNIAGEGSAGHHLYERRKKKKKIIFLLSHGLHKSVRAMGSSELIAIFQNADIIDSKSKEIRPEDDQVLSKLEDIADELPDSSPRFILLSYPHTLVSSGNGLSRVSSPPPPKNTMALLTQKICVFSSHPVV